MQLLMSTDGSISSSQQANLTSKIIEQNAFCATTCILDWKQKYQESICYQKVRGCFFRLVIFQSSAQYELVTISVNQAIDSPTHANKHEGDRIEQYIKKES